MKMRRRVRERRKSKYECRRTVMRSAWENRNAKKDVEFLTKIAEQVPATRGPCKLVSGMTDNQKFAHQKFMAECSHQPHRERTQPAIYSTS